MSFYHALFSAVAYKPQYRLPQFFLMARQYRHIKMLKRAGTGHRTVNFAASQEDPTLRGSLAVDCRACPQPHMNLPDGWEDTDAGEK